MYFKVVRRRKPSGSEGTKGWRALMGNQSTLSLGGLPRFFFLILIDSKDVLMGFNAFGTRLQSLWIMFFLARKDFPCGVRNRMHDKILFQQLRFHFFCQHFTLTYVSAGFCMRTLALILGSWFRKDIHYSNFSSRLNLVFGCATFLDDFPCWRQNVKSLASLQ